MILVVGVVCLSVGFLAGAWAGLSGLVCREIVRELRSSRSLPAHSLRGGKPFMPRRNGLKP